MNIQSYKNVPDWKALAILHNTYLSKMVMDRSIYIIYKQYLVELVESLELNVWNALWVVTKATVTLNESSETFHLNKNLYHDIKLI